MPGINEGSRAARISLQHSIIERVHSYLRSLHAEFAADLVVGDEDDRRIPSLFFASYLFQAEKLETMRSSTSL